MKVLCNNLFSREAQLDYYFQRCDLFLILVDFREKKINLRDVLRKVFICTAILILKSSIKKIFSEGRKIVRLRHT